MTAIKRLGLVPLFMLLAACVTINVYFPAVAAEKAADRIIKDVWGPEDGAPPAPEQTPEGDGADTRGRAPSADRPLAMHLLEALIPPAHAQEPRIDISSPAVKRLTARMEERFSRLRPYYESGAVGLTRDALIAVRDLNGVPLAERGSLRQLVAAENADRNALYREIAVANDRPQWEQRIRDVFAERWVSNAPSGWYYQNDSGRWIRK